MGILTFGRLCSIGFIRLYVSRCLEGVDDGRLSRVGEIGLLRDLHGFRLLHIRNIHPIGCFQSVLRPT